MNTAFGPTLNCGNSGTTMRLLLGLLAGLNRPATLVGDASLSQRPMARVLTPLVAMGAHVRGGPRAPIVLLHHAGLMGHSHRLTIPSGQLKGALLLAGLFASGPTELLGELGGRDHTERMLVHFGAKLQIERTRIALVGPQRLVGRPVDICGDISAAAFWLAAAALVPNSHARIASVGLNETRLGFVRLLERMGANVRIVPARMFAPSEEPVGTIEIEQRALRAADVAGPEVAALIDELPLVAVLATQARGESRICGAGELRHKESDRIAQICRGLAQMGADIRETSDGLIVRGPTPLLGASVESAGDHRIAMALSIAALVARGSINLVGSECVAVSYPNFFAHYPGQVREDCA